MSEQYYDIVNTSKDRWESAVKLHLSAGPLGYTYHSLPVKGTLENVSESQISDQIRLLAKRKRGRPPVIELRKVDYEARLAEQEKAVALQKARGLKKMEARKALAQDEASSPAKESKKKKSRKGPQEILTQEVTQALEAGTELP